MNHTHHVTYEVFVSEMAKLTGVTVYLSQLARPASDEQAELVNASGAAAAASSSRAFASSSS